MASSDSRAASVRPAVYEEYVFSLYSSTRLEEGRHTPPPNKEMYQFISILWNSGMTLTNDNIVEELVGYVLNRGRHV